MATFIQGVTDEFGKIVPYTPNWQFLQSVYATKQAEYDRGFNMIKSLYNSFLNNPLTNSENEQFRSDMFKKLQKSLHSVSAIDLSNPTNVMKAKSLLDPISQDEDLIYDMQVTKHHQQQKGIMNQYKNSTDPEKRAMYSDYSAMDIAFAEDDLRTAKRGDGSIQAVTPRDFTPFEDVNTYLAEMAKKQGLGIKYTTKDPNNPAYLYKIENGEKAYLPFTNWAMTVLGNRFDRQFNVMGRVNGENKIRSMMKEQGISRQDALGMITNDLKEKLYQDKSDLADVSESSLQGVKNKIEIYDRLYKDGFPADKPEIKQQYLELLEAKEILEKDATNSKDDARKISEDNEFLANNIFSFLSDVAKQGTAQNWATSTADATYKMDMEADHVYLNQLKMAQAERHFQLNYKQKQDQFERNLALQQDKLAFEIQKAKNKGEIAGEEHVGQYVAGAEGSAYTGVEVLSESYSQNKDELYNRTFAAENGLINMALGNPNDFAKYSPVIAKLRKKANGQNVKLTPEEANLIKQYYQKIGGERTSMVTNISDSKRAASVLEALIYQTYDAASENMAVYSNSGNSAQASKFHQTFDQSFSIMRTLVQQKENIDEAHQEIAKVIKDPRNKDLFEGAKIVAYTPKGIPIYDLSNVSEAGRTYLSNNVIPAEFSARSRPTGNTYNFTGMTASEAYNLVNLSSEKGVEITTDGDVSMEELRTLNMTSLQQLFNKQMQASYDPATQMAIFRVAVDPTSSEARNLGLDSSGQNFTIKIPYNILREQGSLPRFAKYANMNTVNPTSYGLFEAFSSNADAAVRAPSYMKNSGFNWTVTGSHDANGRRGLLLTADVIDNSGKSRQLNPVFHLIDFTDPSEFTKMSQTINDIWTQYDASRGMSNR